VRGLASPLALAIVLLAGCGTGSSKQETTAGHSETTTSPAPSATSATSVPQPPGIADELSAEIIRRMTDAMGGQQTWDNLPYFRFDFVVVREGKEMARFRHWWDKKNGRCRVEGPDDKGRSVTAIFTLADKKGKSFTDGIVDTDSTNTANIIQMGYERWVNDTYWIIMPFKLRDTGVHVKHARTKSTDDGVDYDVLEVSFNPGIGLTPGDRYWLFVNRQTHLIDRWEMLLQGQQPPPSGATWEAWTDIGPVKLSSMHRVEGKPVMIRFENVAAPATMDETVFTFSRVRG
jgi:hypothetical protein